MHMSRLNELPLPTSTRTVFRAVRGLYRGGRKIKNRLLNRIGCPVIILVYHRVAELAEDPEMLAVSPVNFRRQMAFIKQHFPVLRLTDDWTLLQEPAVVITFDDGYADNVRQALPIMENLGLPATFFVSTAYIDTPQIFWWHRLEAILLREGRFPPRFELKDGRFGHTWETISLPQRKVLYASLAMLMRKVGRDRQDAWLAQLENWAATEDVPEGLHRLMTGEELQRLAASPWATVGAHTVSHTALSALSREEQRREIFSSKQKLQEITGGEIDTFSYPFGRRCEYNKISIALCREAGFKRAAANFPGQVHRWTDPLQLPRHLVRNWDLEAFAGEMKTFWTR